MKSAVQTRPRAAAALAGGGAAFDDFHPAVTARAMRAAARLEGGHTLTATTGLDSDTGIESLFDATMYDGGAAVLRMLRA
jgi:aminopeptidase N